MSVKLVPAKPDDRYARMYFAFVEKDGGFRVELRAEEQADAGYIDLWAADARACKEPLRRLGGRWYVLNERKEKRKTELSDEKAVAEIEEYNAMSAEILAHRTKAWKLVNSAGEAVDVALSFETAKAVYGDEDHNLREVAQEFLNGRANFPLRGKAAS